MDWTTILARYADTLTHIADRLTTADTNTTLDGVSTSGSVEEEEDDTTHNDHHLPTSTPLFDAHVHIVQRLKQMVVELQDNNTNTLTDLQAIDIIEALDDTYRAIRTHQQQRMDIVTAQWAHVCTTTADAAFARNP